MLVTLGNGWMEASCLQLSFLLTVVFGSFLLTV